MMNIYRSTPAARPYSVGEGLQELQTCTPIITSLLSAIVIPYIFAPWVWEGLDVAMELSDGMTVKEIEAKRVQEATTAQADAAAAKAAAKVAAAIAAMEPPPVTPANIQALFDAREHAARLVLQQRITCSGTSIVTFRGFAKLATPVSPHRSYCEARVLCSMHRSFKVGFSLHPEEGQVECGVELVPNGAVYGTNGYAPDRDKTRNTLKRYSSPLGIVEPVRYAIIGCGLDMGNADEGDDALPFYFFTINGKLAWRQYHALGKALPFTYPRPSEFVLRRRKERCPVYLTIEGAGTVAMSAPPVQHSLFDLHRSQLANGTTANCKFWKCFQSHRRVDKAWEHSLEVHIANEKRRDKDYENSRWKARSERAKERERELTTSPEEPEPGEKPKPPCCLQ